MSNPRFPLEILDCVVGFLHDSANALKECCLQIMARDPPYTDQCSLGWHLKFRFPERLVRD